MPQPLRMHQIKRVIEFHLQGHSIRQIERLSGVSRNTIRDYLRRLQQQGRSFQELLGLEEYVLLGLVQSNPEEKNAGGRVIQDRFNVVEQRMEYYKSELSRRGVTRQLLWQEYRVDHPDGYSYSQFCEHLERYLKRDQAVMHLIHRPAEQMQVDFAGGKMSYIDRSTGECIECEVLVCVMPYSHLIYVQALRSQRQEEFISGMAQALTYLGGVPMSIKCDNMKVAVTRANRYEPTFTEAMEFMAAHYGTTILTARVRKPRDKASVEKAVDLAYKNIYAPLRNQIFYSIEQLNAAIRKQVDLFNQQPYQAKPTNRLRQFNDFELPLLKPLPSSVYLIRKLTEGKVQRNYHVILGEDRHQYSVPYALIGKRLKIIYTVEAVEIYDGLARVAVHKRSYQKNGYTTLSEHMPEKHRHYARQKGWNGEYFEQQASRIGKGTLAVIQRVLQSRYFYEQTYNSCLGILRLGNQYGHQRLEAACLRIKDAPLVSYGMVANILKKHLDRNSSDPELFTPPHEQIRGPKTYQ
ncbi:MAG TPA: IS21 family transposase [Cyclobacteriaceae bacterium]|nr:IS21 family transposase [Cyclobacteriaceae bacterium]